MFNGNRLRTERLKAGYSKRWLAKELGVKRRTIGRWERSENTPGDASLRAIARLFGLTVRVFIPHERGE